MALDFAPRINGYEYDWNNIEVTLLGIPVVGITKIDYDFAQDMKPNYGWGPQPISYSYGRVTYTASIELYLSTWNEIIAAAPFNDPCQIPPFTMSVSYGNFHQSTVVSYRDILHDVQFMKHDRKAGEGEMGMKITIPLMISALEFRVL